MQNRSLQPRFAVIDIAAVAEGIDCAEGIFHRAGGGTNVTPRVVGVLHNSLSGCGRDNRHNIALNVGDVLVDCAVGSAGALSVGIVAIVPRQVDVRHGSHGLQLPAMLPGVVPNAVAVGISYRPCRKSDRAVDGIESLSASKSHGCSNRLI